MPQAFRIGLIQTSCSTDPNENLAKTVWRIREAAGRGAQVICLQELFRSQYFCREENAELFALAESIPGPSTETLGKLARELRIVIVASLFERRAAGLYHNTAAVLSPAGEITALYRKMHIPDDPLYFEKFYFTPGDLGFEPIQTSVGKLGVLVCWDQWYPEAARLMALAGADLLLYPTAIGWVEEDAQDEQARQRDAWITIQRAHAVANGLPVLVCNRIGFEKDPSEVGGGIRFWGSSFVAGPQGEILVQADSTSYTVLVTDVDMGRSEAVRRIWPYLRDRRIDFYDELTERFRD
jgi:N-carbamoylputrescine amidase